VSTGLPVKTEVTRLSVGGSIVDSNCPKKTNDKKWLWFFNHSETIEKKIGCDFLSI
jgi:hypothetical protein